MKYYVAVNPNTHACKHALQEHRLLAVTDAVLSAQLWYRRQHATQGIYTHFLQLNHHNVNIVFMKFKRILILN